CVDCVDYPFSGSLKRSFVTTYDILDRVTSTRDIGPAAPYVVGNVSGTAPAMTLWVTNNYDSNGNLLSTSRRSQPDTLHIGTLTQSWTYDNANRRITATDVHSQTEQWHYDAAGNDTSWTTRRGSIIRMQYDATNRLVSRTTPAVTVAPDSAKLPTGEFANTNLPAKFPHFAPGFTYDAFNARDVVPPPLVLPQDVARFVYDQEGRLDSATNNDARVGRAYYPNGALKTEVQQPAVADTLETPSGDRYGFHDYRLDYSYDLSGRRVSRTSVIPQ